ncbi:hypothetical protein GCK32_022063 [Trichostrongylus colubriformis]|uniref:Uncharacterized protein n=1 Tax=Trichostrongylus colubriformis TaxID=6319 RepID=A0AAN8F6D5_TRICO
MPASSMTMTQDNLFILPPKHHAVKTWHPSGRRFGSMEFV